MRREKISLIIITTLVIGMCTAFSFAMSSLRIEEKKVKSLQEQIENQEKQYKEMNEKNEQLIDELKIQLSETTDRLENARQNIRKYNQKVSFDSDNVTITSKTTVYHMRRALQGTGLYDDAESFVEAEEEYGVNAFFIAAIAAQESSWGKSPRAVSQNNLTGHAVYNSMSRGSSFNTRSSSVLSTAKMLKENYLTPGGAHYNGLKVYNVNTKYCFLEDGVTVDYNWSTNICSIAYGLVYKANDFNKLEE